MKIPQVLALVVLLLVSSPFEVDHATGDGIVVDGTLSMPLVMNHGVTDVTMIESEQSGGYASFNAIPNVTLADAGFDHLVGFQSRPQYSGSGTLYKMSGFTSQLNVNGSVAWADGVEITSPIGAGTIDTFYGVYIGWIEKAIHRWAIYSVDNIPSYLGGSLDVRALKVRNLPAYANNADAIAHGLAIGDFYRMGDLVAVVH